MSAPRRLFAAHIPSAGERVELGAEPTQHARVLRLPIGGEVTLFDGRGREADAVIEALDPAVRCRVERVRERADREPELTLCLGMPKGAKLDDIVRMCTELGVARLLLAHTERSVSRPDEQRAGKRLDRLHKIAREASRQSGRAEVPSIEPPAPFADVLARAADVEVRLILTPHARGGLADAVPHGARTGAIAIGPEGGLSEAEIERAERHGYVSAALGPGVLRVETAAVVVSALVLQALGGLRPR